MKKAALAATLIISHALVAFVSYAYCALDTQSYYAAAISTLIAEVLEASESGDTTLSARLREFSKAQRITYESRDNLLENVRSFHQQGLSAREATTN
jgi:hypothetical protein